MTIETFKARLKEITKGHWRTQVINNNDYNTGWDECLAKMFTLIEDELEAKKETKK